MKHLRGALKAVVASLGIFRKQDFLARADSEKNGAADLT